MFARRPNSFELAPVHRALALGQYEVAFAILERATERHYDVSVQANLRLYLAAIYALYGPEGLDGGWRCLQEAKSIAPGIVKQSLYRALYWEFCAYRGDPQADVRRGATAAADDNATARYHAASALFIVNAWEDALELLLATDTAALPDYLLWRRWSLIGQCYERSGAWDKAAEAFEQSASLSHGTDQQGEMLSLAASWIEAGRAQDALSVLANVRESLLLEPAEKAVRAYLEGRAQLALGNPHTALGLFYEALGLEAQADEASYSLRLMLGQTYLELGQVERALQELRAALELAPPPYRAFVLHEIAFALVEADRLEEARETLLSAAKEDYPYRAELYADLADLEFRLGDLYAADDLARRALDLGATSPACLTLGQIASEYFRYDEAIEWFEQALSASPKGEREWLTAQEMLIESRVQQGFKEPNLIVMGVKNLLQFLGPYDERRAVLERYLSQAKSLMGGYERLLN